MKKCRTCGKYTLKELCPYACSGQCRTDSPHPAKFSPQDAYARYRRMMKREAGLI